MFEQIKISPSILSANQINLKQAIDKIEHSGASFIHVDVMDGHFVPNLTFGIPLIKNLKEYTNLPLDVHLMIDNPITQIDWYLEAGADIISVHAEACSIDEMSQIIRKIHGNNKKACIAIKPNTPTSVLDDFIADIDMVLIMSVEPGFSGQNFMQNSIDKISEVCAIASSFGTSPLIETDGGIGVGSAQKVCAAGADVLVCGNAIFGYEDIDNAIVSIKADGEIGRQAGLKKWKTIEEFL